MRCPYSSLIIVIGISALCNTTVLLSDVMINHRLFLTFDSSQRRVALLGIRCRNELGGMLHYYYRDAA
jgi:hypothetical protein